jgi:hypothetical protein
MLAGPFDVVVDVGAGRGEFAVECLKAWPECVVHSFEPARGVANSDGLRWHWHRVALNDTTRRLDDYDDLIVGRALLSVAVSSCRLQILLGAGETLSSFAALLLPGAASELYAELIADYVTDAGFEPRLRLEDRELWART